METNYRGFFIAGDEALLTSYNVAADSYATDLALLEQLTSDDAALAARWQGLDRQAAPWQRQVVEPGIAFRRATLADAGAEHALASASHLLGVQDIDSM